MSDLGTRTDCTRDDQVTICRNASLLGYSSNVAKRGYWIAFDSSNPEIRFGRVVDRVRCEGKTHVEVIGLSSDLTNGCVRWVNSDQITACYKTLPLDLLAFMFGDWTYRSAEKILARAARGCWWLVLIHTPSAHSSQRWHPSSVTACGAWSKNSRPQPSHWMTTGGGSLVVRPAGSAMLHDPLL